jgi:hypothetical protein
VRAFTLQRTREETRSALVARQAVRRKVQHHRIRASSVGTRQFNCSDCSTSLDPCKDVQICPGCKGVVIRYLTLPRRMRRTSSDLRNNDRLAPIEEMAEGLGPRPRASSV